jgi:hypothetical protein
MEAYRRASGADSLAEVEAVEQDLISAYGATVARAITWLRQLRQRLL